MVIPIQPQQVNFCIYKWFTFKVFIDKPERVLAGTQLMFESCTKRWILHKHLVKQTDIVVKVVVYFIICFNFVFSNMVVPLPQIKIASKSHWTRRSRWERRPGRVREQWRGADSPDSGWSTHEQAWNSYRRPDAAREAPNRTSRRGVSASVVNVHPRSVLSAKRVWRKKESWTRTSIGESRDRRST